MNDGMLSKSRVSPESVPGERHGPRRTERADGQADEGADFACLDCNVRKNPVGIRPDPPVDGGLPKVGAWSK